MKFTEECVMCKEKDILVKKMFTKEPESKRQSIESQHIDSPVKKKFRA